MVNIYLCAQHNKMAGILSFYVKRSLHSLCVIPKLELQVFIALFAILLVVLSVNKTILW